MREWEAGVGCRRWSKQNTCQVGKAGPEMTAELVKMKGKFSKTQMITKTMTRSSFSVLPGIPTHQPLQLSFLMFYHFMYETKLPNKAVAGLKPSTDLRDGGVFLIMRKGFMLTKPWRRLCSRSTNHLVISSAHLFQWLRVTSSSSSALIISPSALLSWFLPAEFITSLPTSPGHFTVLLQRSWCCTSNHVGIKLLTRVWQEGEAMPLKCKADISGSNNDGVFPLSSSSECWSEFCQGLNSILAAVQTQGCLFLDSIAPRSSTPLKCIHNSHKLKQLYFL